MKVVIIFLTLLTLAAAFSNQTSSLVALCLSGLIKSNSATFQNQINILAETNSSHDLVEEILLELTNEFITVNLVRYKLLVDFNPHQLIVWIVDSWDFFVDAIEEVDQVNHEFRGHFVIVLKFADVDVWREIFRYFWDLQIVDVLLAVTVGNEILMVGYEPFRDTCCRCVEPIVANRCVGGFLKNRKLFGGSVENVFGCPLRLSTFSWFPFREVVKSEDGQLMLQGKGAELLGIIQKKLNFSLEVKIPVDGFTWGRIFPNGSAIGSLKLVVDGMADFTLGGYLIYSEMLQFMSMTSDYYVSDFVFVVPEELVSISSMERLLQPFQVAVWIAVLIMLGLMYAVMTCYNLVIVGSSRQHVLLMLIRSFFGGSLPLIPKANFIRFHMILWLFYGVVIRECYNSAMYGFLTANPGPTDISSLTKMAENGYQFVVPYVLYDLLFANSAQFNGTFTLVDEEFFSRMFVDVIQSRKRIALITQPELIAYFNQQHPESINFRISEEKVISFYYSMLFRRAWPLVQTFNAVLRQILRMGLISKWKADWLNERYLAMTLSNDPITVLTNDHLFDGYMFYALGITTSIAIFFAEVASKHLAKSTSKPIKRIPFRN